MFQRTRLPLVALGLLACLALAPSALLSQEKSVKPGINQSFQNGADVKKFLEKFEGESREIFQQRHEIVTACQVKPGMAVADIGACTGLFTRLFADAVGPKGKVYAVDIAPNFIEHIEKSSRQQGLMNIVGIVCTQDSSKLPKNSVDLIFICDTYHHFEFPFKTLQTIHEALRPGGQIVLIDFHRIEGKTPQRLLNHVRAGQEVFTREIVSSGFKVVAEKNFLTENYFVRFEKVEPKP